MAFNWTIIQDDGVSDRFETREEAEAVLSDYEGGTVTYTPEWWS